VYFVQHKFLLVSPDPVNYVLLIASLQTPYNYTLFKGRTDKCQNSEKCVCSINHLKVVKPLIASIMFFKWKFYNLIQFFLPSPSSLFDTLSVARLDSNFFKGFPSNFYDFVIIYLWTKPQVLTPCLTRCWDHLDIHTDVREWIKVGEKKICIWYNV